MKLLLIAYCGIFTALTVSCLLGFAEWPGVEVVAALKTDPSARLSFGEWVTLYAIPVSFLLAAVTALFARDGAMLKSYPNSGVQSEALESIPAAKPGNERLFASN